MIKHYEDKDRLLASLLEKEGITVRQRSEIKPMDAKADLPLSFAQERFWFLNQLEGGAHYNDHLALRLRGMLNEEALEWSLNEIVNRHQTLRTTFVSIEGEPRQQIMEPGHLNLRRFDLSNLPTENREPEAVRQATNELKKPFELDRSPAFRMALWCLGPEDHFFLLCINQIINDSWSLKVFTSELNTLYSSFVSGKTAQLPELPIQYSDFAVWQRDQLQNSELSSEMNYWKKQLSGELPILELPSDRQRSAVKTFKGARRCFTLSPGLVEAIRQIAQSEKATPFMVLLAAFKALIFRYTGQEDIAIGFPIANRDRIETENLIGVLINPLVLRSNFSVQPTFRELLSRVREIALDAYANQNLPFEKLVEALHPNRDISHPPLFQILFDYNNVPMPDLELPNLKASPVELDAGTAKFDLSLELTESENEIRGFFEYSSDLFSDEMISRMSNHFQILLESAVADPDRSVSLLRIMSDQESRQLLIDWNDTDCAFGEHLSIHSGFERQVEKTPNLRAIIFEGRSYTFTELNQSANRIAHFLLKSNIQPGSRVGICFERSPEMISCLLGVLKAGCQYVPFDPNYPRKRLEFMIEDAELSLLLTQSHLIDRLTESASPVFAVDTGSGELISQSEENPNIEVAAGGAAYVIYTSGSTGRPKGVTGTHQGAMNRFQWMWQKYHFAPGEVCCQKTSLSFVDSVWEIFGPLLQGVPSVIIPDEITKDSERFIDTLAEHAVTRIVVVPSLLEMLLIRSGDLKKRLPALRYCISSGEALSPELCRRFMKVLPETVLINLYGSSEASADSTFYEVTADDKRSKSPVPIGRPISNTKVYVLDRHCIPVPIAIPGELHIGGAGLSVGYINRPELNDQRFIEDPFMAESRLYKTGDITRYRPDGNIEYLGRVDDQVKIRGMRVEPGEIESILRQHNDVNKAAVVVREEPLGNKFLVAYVVSKRPSPVGSELRAFLRQNLPDHMVPAFVNFVDALPTTPSGKVDRITLRNSEKFRPAPALTNVGPKNDLERKLMAIWENVLSLETVGVTDNFFDLGGHSLLAVRLFYEIEKALNKKLPLAALFKAPSIEKLAEVISRDQREESESSIVPIQPIGSKPPFFCVHAAGGNVLFYRDLARRLGPDQPFYGLQARRIGGRQDAHSDVGEMAAYYIEAIRTVQPDGPYYLGGASFGGIVALEIAHQLRALGEEAAFIALFDTRGPGYPRFLPGTTLLRSRVLDLARRLENHWDNMRLLDSGTRLDYVFGKAQKAKHKTWRAKRKYRDISRTHGPAMVLRTLLDKALGRSRPIRYEAPGEMPDDYRKTEGNIQMAWENYVPRYYDGNVTLFRARKQELGIYPDPTLGWEPLLAKLEIHEVQGHHGSLTAEPHVQFLAEKLRSSLSKAQYRIFVTTEARPEEIPKRRFASAV